MGVWTALGAWARGSSVAIQHFDKFRFDPAPLPGQYPDIYLKEPRLNTASVNAGDYRLYVGGGSNNAAFAKLFIKHQPSPLKMNNKKWPYNEDYQTIHTALLRGSRAAGGQIVSASEIPEANALLSTVGLAASYGKLGQNLEGDTVPKENEVLRGATGSVFIDVFKADWRPIHAKNVAMLYVVGPKGETKSAGAGVGSPVLPKNEFLASVELLAKEALQTVITYNKAASKEGLPLIEEVRWCLVSGGVYRHQDSTKIEVAKATISGMRSVEDDGSVQQVTFTFDEDCFKIAYESMNSE